MKKNKKSRINKIAAMSISATMMTGAVVAATPTNVLAESSFLDVKESDYFYDAVNQMTEREVIKGYENKEFRPYQSVTRAQAAKMLTLTLDLDIHNVPDPGFNDISKDDWYYPYISALVDAGIISGYEEDQTYRPYETLTRAQMTKILSIGFGFKETSLLDNPFKDVNADSWYSPYLTELIKHKITTGKTSELFAPLSAVTRGQMAAFIHRSEQVNKLDEATGALLSIDDENVVLTTGTYRVSEDLKEIFNIRNSAVLKDAEVTYSFKDGELQLKKLTLKASGKSETQPVILDGNLTSLNADLIIKGTHVKVQNLKGINNLTVYGTDQGSFDGTDISVLGRTSITPSEELSAASEKLFNVQFLNASLNTVAQSFEGTSVMIKGTSSLLSFAIFADGSLQSAIRIPVMQLLKNVSNFDMIGEAGTVYISTSGLLTLSGSMNINLLNTDNAELNLTGKGNVNKFDIQSSTAAINLSEQLTFSNIIVPENKSAKELIRNYDQVKNNIGMIDNIKNPDIDPPPVVVPSNPGKPVTKPKPVEPVEKEIVSVETLESTVARGEEVKLPETVTVTMNDTSTEQRTVSWEGTVVTDEVGEFYFKGKIEGYDEPILYKLTVQFQGLSVKDGIATVTSGEALKYAEESIDVEEIHLTKEINLTEELATISKKVVIPDGVAEQTFDFNGTELNELHVIGDKNTVKNCVIVNLTIDQEVDDLELENVTDTAHSSHSFEGGGGESIVFTGNTTFKGNITVTAGDTIQIRNEGQGKVEGTLWVEEGHDVIINAPVDNVVVNSTSIVDIQQPVANLMIRSAATLKIKDGTEITQKTKRPGVEIKFVDADGKELEGELPEFEVVLDKSELERLIAEAEGRLLNAEYEGRHDDYPSSSKETLETTLETVKTVLDLEGATVDNQNKIDENSTELRDAIATFKQSKIYVDRTPLREMISEAKRTVGRADSAEHSSSISVLEQAITVADEVYWTYKVTVAEITSAVDTLKEANENFKAETETIGDKVVTLTFDLELEGFESENIRVRVFRNFENRSYEEHEAKILNLKEEASRYSAEVSGFGIGDAKGLTFVFHTGDRVFYKSITKEEFRNQNQFAVDVYPDSTLDITLPEGLTEEKGYKSFGAAILDDTGVVMGQFTVHHETQIPSGRYNLDIFGVAGQSSYSFIEEDLVLNAGENTLNYLENYQSVDLVTKTTTEAAMRVDHVFVSFENESGDFVFRSTSSNREEGLNKFYTNRDDIKGISADVIFVKDDQFWSSSISQTFTEGLKENSIMFENSFEFEIRGAPPEYTYNSNDYFDFQIVGFSNRTRAFNLATGRSSDMHYKGDDVLIQITVTDAQGNSVEKEVESTNTDISIENLLEGLPTKSGEFNIKMNIESGTPFVVAPFEQTITISGE
ncbi:S-layer homology domain-containing protein [Jeotgalibacillus terrae]|uniref:S-layer homology domain-containing protein n=1 Tax=Jeotgalibacillus terrae TaxID=587735 RepID=A0ABW5ZC12_9BACL|nr:S-layer homology domain-containing protein [Jeotgalibacillus terrae]MBM7577876.1 hypothetical protein [Jeotgalibacillus terrae]